MFMKRAFFAILMLAGLASSAQATAIEFEGFSNTTYSASITRSGFVIGNVAGDEQHFHEITSTGFGLPSNGTGVLLNDRDTRIFVEASGGADFTLTSVDVAAATNNLPAVGITIQGFLNNVSTGIINLASLGTGYTTLLGAVLGTVDRIVFDGTGGQGGFVLDNLTLNESVASVPLPAALPLLAAGLGALGFAGSRRKRKAAATA